MLPLFGFMIRPLILDSFARAVLALTIPLILIELTITTPTAFAQLNFEPLEEGDYVEVEEKLTVLEGIAVDLDYAAWVISRNGKEFRRGEEGTGLHQEILLGLRTIFHPDVSLQLSLQLDHTALKDSDLRAEERRRLQMERRLPEAQTNTVWAREAFLRYDFNPRSPLFIGKQRVLLGDKRGKTLDAILPAIQFDCRAGTWCVPFGIAWGGSSASDTINHIALRYTSWDEQLPSGASKLEVEIFSISSTESNVPLGKDFGPGLRHAEFPEDSAKNPTLFQDGGPIYYDAKDQDFFGLLVHWDYRNWFLRYDVTSSQGERVYHQNRQENGSFSGKLESLDETEHKSAVKGVVQELEVGYGDLPLRWAFHWMQASGDDSSDSEANEFYRERKDYFELVPGSYGGTRMFFNGAAYRAEGGGGLGHSVSNIRLIGSSVRWTRQDPAGVSIHFGLYALNYLNPIRNVENEKVSRIGVEANAVFRFQIHPAVQLHLEADFISAGEAFRRDVYTEPKKKPDNMVQGILRLIYSF